MAANPEQARRGGVAAVDWTEQRLRARGGHDSSSVWASALKNYKPPTSTPSIFIATAGERGHATLADASVARSRSGRREHDAPRTTVQGRPGCGGHETEDLIPP